METISRLATAPPTCLKSPLIEKAAAAAAAFSRSLSSDISDVCSPNANSLTPRCQFFSIPTVDSSADFMLLSFDAYSDANEVLLLFASPEIIDCIPPQLKMYAMSKV